MTINNSNNLLKDESLSQKLIKKGFRLYLFSYLIGPLGYLTRIIISNSVSVEEVGILYSIIGFIGLLSGYNGLGLTESLKYFIPQYYIKKQYNYIKTSVLWSLGVQILTSIIIILFLYFGADWLAIHYFHSPESFQILQYFCIYFFAVNIFQVLGAIFLSFQDTFNNKFTEFVRIISIFLFTGLFFLIGKKTIINYSLGRIIGLFLALGVALFIFFRKYHFIFNKGKLVYDTSMLKTFWKYSIWTFLSMNIGVLLGLVDQQMIIVILGPESAGYYTNYQSLLNILSILINPIFALLLPLFTEIFIKKDTKKLTLLQNFLYTYLSVFTLSLGTLLIVLGPEIASILFGQKFLFSGILLTISAGFFVLQILLFLNFTILASIGEVKTKTLIAFSVVWVNIILNFILLPRIGVYGAVFSTIIGWFLLWLLSFRLVYKNCAIRIDIKFILKNIIVFAIGGTILYIIKNQIFILEDTMRIKNLLYLILIGVVWYGIIGVVNIGKLKFLREEVKRLRG